VHILKLDYFYSVWAVVWWECR